MQTLGTKKSRNLLGQKNDSTSWDKKITQPLKTKPFTTPTTKIMLSIGPITTKLVHTAPNCSKWHQICPNMSK